MEVFFILAKSELSSEKREEKKGIANRINSTIHSAEFILLINSFNRATLLYSIFPPSFSVQHRN